MNSKELHWLAGLLEGEGWFGISKQSVRGKNYENPAISVKMVDADIIYYVKRLAGHGSIGKADLPSGKTAYIWRTSGEKAVKLMEELYLILGTRRQGQINLVFESWKAKKEGLGYKVRTDLIKELNLDELFSLTRKEQDHEEA